MYNSSVCHFVFPSRRHVGDGVVGTLPKYAVRTVSVNMVMARGVRLCCALQARPATSSMDAELDSASAGGAGGVGIRQAVAAGTVGVSSVATLSREREAAVERELNSSGAVDFYLKVIAGVPACSVCETYSAPAAH